MLKDVTAKYKRNMKIEEKAIDNFCRKLDSEISKSKVKDLLEKRKFKGYYLVDNSFLDNTNGTYYGDEDYILLDKDNYDIETIDHEFYHAVICNRIVNTKNIYARNFGKGIEEGLAGQYEHCFNISFSELIKRDNLLIQTLIHFDLLLYMRDKNRKYHNLLTESLYSPKTVLATIKNCFANTGLDDNLVYSISRNFVSYCDMINELCHCELDERYIQCLPYFSRIINRTMIACSSLIDYNNKNYSKLQNAAEVLGLSKFDKGKIIEILYDLSSDFINEIENVSNKYKEIESKKLIKEFK